MNHPRTSWWLALLLGASAACSSGGVHEGLRERPTPQTPVPTPAPPEIEPEVPLEVEPLEIAREANARAISALTTPQAERYLERLSLMLVGRTLTPEERAQIEAGAGAAVRPMLAQWVKEPHFARAMAQMISIKLVSSGQADAIDYDRPGNLLAHLIREDRPLGEFVTADYCVGPQGEDVECDSEAPYNAGVLTTRAFLASSTSRFNLHRASTLMKVFACRGYPMSTVLQPPLQAEVLIPMFQANTPEEQTVAEATNGFGNGFGCYSCHSQFSAHAQLFVKFDEGGTWRADATGLQDPEGELGRSLHGLMASHLDDPESAANERSQFFGSSVENLADVGQVLAEHELFYACTARNFMEYGFGLTESEAKTISEATLREIAQLARDAQPTPTASDLAIEAFSHPGIITALVATSTQE